MAKVPGNNRRTRDDLLKAAGEMMREVGYGAMSTRRVAEKAGVPLSQIHYHFGSMQGLLLELLKAENAKLLERQSGLYESDLPLAEKWDRACRFLEEDMASGYVRLLHEMMYAAMADSDLRAEMIQQLDGWKRLLTEVAREAMERHGPVGPFTAEEVAFLVAQCFLGLETMLLLDLDRAQDAGMNAVRKIGRLIADYESAETR
jgi:AcrR family transcriptional regulator